MFLARQGPPVGTEVGAWVLQQQPLDHQYFATGDDPRPAVDSQLDQQFAVIRLGVDPHGVADGARKVDVDRRVSEAPQPQLVEQTEAFEQKLDPVL